VRNWVCKDFELRLGGFGYDDSGDDGASSCG